MINLNTNLGALIVQSNLKTSTNGLNIAIERMTTGFKINHAKDNAAGYSIATKLSSQLSSYDVALDNASMGLDMLTTAQDSLDLITSHYQRMRDLAEQAANGTYGADSLKAIQSEIDARKAEIERIVANTEYNGIKLFAQDDGTNAAPISTFNVLRQTTKAPSIAVDESKRVVNQTTFTKGETYFVTNSDDLVKLQDLVNSGVDTTDVTFELTSNIDMKGINFRGIGTVGGDEYQPSLDLVFKGDFKGNNHVISNLTINTTEDYVGLFGAVLGGSIDSVGLENCEVSGGGYVGGLAGAIVGGSITNSYATASVTGDEFVGGLVGFCSGSSITNSYATGSVTGTGSSVGGLVGAAYAIPTLNGYYDTQKTGQTVGVGNGSYTGTVTGVTTAELEELIKNGTLPQYNYGGGTGGGVLGGSYEVTLQVGIHSDKSSSITIDVGIGKIDLNIDVTTPDGAGNALTKLDEYIKNINEKQTQMGSAYNRLESVIESIGVSIDNLTSTRSTIRDADIAEESSAYIRNQILQQASATLLAAANQTPSIALQLL